VAALEIGMKLRSGLVCLLFLACSAALALEQEETFTDLTPGQDQLDPAMLADLIRSNDVRAMNNVALLWAKGYDGKQSYDEAMRWWKEAARRGYTVAMNNIGLLYANGHGVPQDFQQAFDWWHQSAFLGNAWAMNNVGDLYENGLGVHQDFNMAMTWYRSAAEQGQPMAMYNIGLMHEAGKGVGRDYAEALAWFRKSADKGYASAMHSIGGLHERGLGVARDPVEALAWYSVADKRYPPEDAEEARANKRDMEKLSRSLAPAQRDSARERAAAIEAQVTPVTPKVPPGPGLYEKST
jgi:TPR repeat protein